MALTVLEPEGLYPDTRLEEEVMGPWVRVLRGEARTSLAELPDALCAQADGLMTLRLAVPGEQLARFPRLRVVVRMGVGYDRVERAPARPAASWSATCRTTTRRKSRSSRCCWRWRCAAG